MANGKHRKQKTCAGGIVYKRTKDNYKFCIVNTHNGSDWQIPKGHQDAGESVEETALREVREESGLNATIVEELGTVWYEAKSKKQSFDKTVHFYLMRYKSGSTKNHDHEVSEVRWVTEREAIHTLSYQDEVDIFKKAVRKLKRKK